MQERKWASRSGASDSDEQLTEDRYGLQLDTNVLGHYYFTMLLMPLLLTGTETSWDGKARMASTSSFVHIFSLNMDSNTFTDGATGKIALRRPSFHSRKRPSIGNLRLTATPRMYPKITDRIT